MRGIKEVHCDVTKLSGIDRFMLHIKDRIYEEMWETCKIYYAR
jgi:hypothetical protein